MILVCGRPGSGNKLIREHLKRSGLHAHVYHADGATFTDWPKNDIDAIVVPIRLDEEARQKTRVQRLGSFDELLKKLNRKRDLPTYLITYEEIQRTGGKAIDDIIRAMGHEPAPWPEGEDYHRGRVLNEEERAAQHT